MNCFKIAIQQIKDVAIKSLQASVDQITLLFSSNSEDEKKLLKSELPAFINEILNAKELPHLNLDEFFKQVLRYMLQSLDDLQSSELFKEIFFPSQFFYLYNDLENESEQEYFFRQYLQNEQHDQFIQSLKPGDQVDCIKKDKFTSTQSWSRGIIKEIIEKNNKVEFKVQYERDPSEPISLKQSSIQPFKSRSHEFDQLINLKIGETVDACDTKNVWIPSTVYERYEENNQIDPSNKVIHYEIGYRVDLNGWGPNYDEKILATSPRLALPVGSHSRAFWKEASIQIEELVIEDSNDLLYKDDYDKQKFYGIVRLKQGRTKTIPKLLNWWGELGGFDQLIEKIANGLGIEQLANYLHGLGRSHAQIYRLYAEEFVQKVFSAVKKNLTCSTEQNIRNMTKERLDICVNSLNSLLKRAFSLKEKYQMIEIFKLELVAICFKSEFLDKKIQALKQLIDIARNLSNNKYIKLNQLMQWIKEHQIFEELFNKNVHLQLMQRTSDFLRFLITNEQLNQNYMEQIFELMKSDDIEIRQTIYKSLGQVTINCKEVQISFFLNKINQLPIERVACEELNFIFDMTKFSNKLQHLIQAAIQLFWKVIEFQSQNLNYTFKQSPHQIEEKARSNLSQLFKNFTIKEPKMDLLNTLIENIDQAKSVSSSLTTLQNLIQSFPLKNDIWSQKIVVEELLIERSLMSILIKSLRNLPNDARYRRFLQEHLNLIRLLRKISGQNQLIITSEFLNAISELFIANSRKDFDTEVFSKWIRKRIRKEDDPQIIEIYKKFYLESFHSEELAAKLTKSAFGIFKLLMIKCNQLKFVRGNKKKIYLSIDVDPSTLLGMDFLWEIIFRNTIGDVFDKAVIFLVMLHVNLSAELNHNAIMVKLIDEILEKANIDASKSLSILQILLNQSERHGVGSLQSLSSLIKGHLLKLTIHNEVSRSPAQFELKLYSNITVMRLRKEIAKQLDINFEDIRLIRVNILNFNNEIPDTDNGKTLSDISLSNFEYIEVRKKYNEQKKLQKKTEQKTESGVPDDKIKKQNFGPYDKLFGPFQNILEEFKDILSEISDVVILPKDRLIKYMKGKFEDFDPSKYKDSLLNQMHRPNFFHLIDLIKAEVFSKNLFNENVDAVASVNLESQENQQMENQQKENETYLKNEKNLPAYILVTQEKFFFKLLELMDKSKEISIIASRIINRLPPSETILQDILNFKGVKYEIENDSSQNNWEFIFPRNFPAKLLYVLKIIDYLMSDDEPDEEIKSDVNKGKWRSEFIAFGGFEQLSQVFQNSVGLNNILDRKIISSVLPIINNYLSAALMRTNKQIFKCQSYCRSVHYTLKQIHDDLFNIEMSEEQKKKELFQRVTEPVEFLMLAQKFKGELGEKILSTLDMVSLYRKIFLIIMEFLSNDKEIDSEQRIIIEYGISLITQLAIYDQKACFQEFLKTSEPLVMLIFYSKNLLIRKMFANMIYIIYQQCFELLKLKLPELLFKVFPNNDNPKFKEADQYFVLHCQIISESPKLDHYKQLVDKLIDLIKSHQCIETTTSLISDRYLTGYLFLLDALFSKFPDLGVPEFSDYLFYNCLFNVDSGDVKCKAIDSRTGAYQVLASLMKLSFSNQIYNDLVKLVYRAPLVTGFQHKPSKDIKSYSGFVGIRNLACICYMNAMLQQFYMTEAFRYAVLMFDDKKPSNLKQVKDNQGKERVIDDNIVHQLQKMFTFLELSDQADYNPFEFCYSFKDYDGLPINVGVQQDTQEFINMIFDKLEIQLRGTFYPQLIQSIFGGKISNQLVCKGCDNIKDNEETFYNLSVKVSGMKNLQESLEHLIQGEVISDYFCEKCQSKNEVVKRQCLQKLPNVFIIHLQRIVFNLDTLMNEKICDRLEFPKELNVRNYTREALLQSDIKHKEFYDYKLKGVVVHTGAAQFGHYYSYIHHKDNKWMEFNDSQIKSFDVKSLASECFGGINDTSDLWQKIDSSQYSKSAYVLVYDRVEKEDIHLEFSSVTEKKEFITKIQLESEDSLQLVIKQGDLKKFIPEQWRQEVIKDNNFFLFEKHIYSDEFFKFYKNLLSIVSSDSTKINNFPMFLQNALYLMIEILSHAYDNSSIKDFIPMIEQMFSQLPPNQQLEMFKILFDSQKKILDILLQADAPARTAFTQIILYAIQTLQVSLPGILKDNQSLPARFIEEFLIKELNLTVAKLWAKSKDYFELIRDLALKNFDYFDSLQMIAILIDFFLEKDSPIKDLSPKPHKMGNAFNQPNFTPIIECIAFLLEKKEDLDDLTENEKKCLTSTQFYKKALNDSLNFDALRRIINKMSLHNESRVICDALLEQFPCSMGLIQSFLNIYDEFQLQRIQWILGYPQPTQFGCPLSLTSQSTKYISLLGDQVTLLEQLYSSKDRIVQKQLLQLIVENNRLFEYFIMLPPPSYIHQNYIDWFEDCEQLQAYFEKSALYLSERETLAPLYIIGKEISRKKGKVLEIDQDVFLKFYDCSYYLTISLPTGQSNLVFPEKILNKMQKIQTNLISSDSNIWNLLEDKRKQKLKPTQNDKSDEISFSTFVDERNPLAEQQMSQFVKFFQDIPESENCQNEEKQQQKDEEKQYQNDEENQYPKDKEINQNLSKQEEQQEENQKHRIDAKLYEAVFIREYFIDNKSGDTFQLTLSLEPLTEAINFRVPQKIIHLVNPNQLNQRVVTICKIDHSQDFGDYNETVQLQVKERKGNYQPPVNTQKNKPTLKVETSDEVKVYPSKETIDLTNRPAFINCPSCASMQPSCNAFCEVCYMEFN